MCENEFLESLDVFDVERKSVEQPPLMAATDNELMLIKKKKKEKTLMKVFYWLLPEEKRLYCPHKHMSQSWIFLQSRQCGGEKKPCRS